MAAGDLNFGATYQGNNPGDLVYGNFQSPTADYGLNQSNTPAANTPWAPVQGTWGNGYNLNNSALNNWYIPDALATSDWAKQFNSIQDPTQRWAYGFGGSGNGDTLRQMLYSQYAASNGSQGLNKDAATQFADIMSGRASGTGTLYDGWRKALGISGDYSGYQGTDAKTQMLYGNNDPTHQAMYGALNPDGSANLDANGNFVGATNNWTSAENQRELGINKNSYGANGGTNSDYWGNSLNTPYNGSGTGGFGTTPSAVTTPPAGQPTMRTGTGYTDPVARTGLGITPGSAGTPNYNGTTGRNISNDVSVTPKVATGGPAARVSPWYANGGPFSTNGVR